MSPKGRVSRREVWVGHACAPLPPRHSTQSVPPHLWSVAPRHAARHLWSIRVGTTSSSSAGHLRRQPSDLATHQSSTAQHITAQHEAGPGRAGQQCIQVSFWLILGLQASGTLFPCDSLAWHPFHCVTDSHGCTLPTDGPAAALQLHAAGCKHTCGV